MATDRDDTLNTIERLLGEIASANPKAKGAVAEVRRLLKRLEPTPRSPSQRRVSDSTTYSVSGTGLEASLAEQRPHAQPLRVSRRVYDGIVSVFEQADRALPFDEVMTEAAKGDHPPAEWQARVVLRFLAGANPPFLLRERSRYRAVDPEKLRAAASKRWSAAGR